MQRFSWSGLVEFGVRLLNSKGVPEMNARHIAEVVVKTEAAGVRTHGIVLFPYFDASVGRDIDPVAEPVVQREKGASALVDGRNSFGQLAMKLASEIAVDKARTHGIAMVAVKNSHWLGDLGIYVLPLAEQGFLAQLWAQTSTCKDCAPVGGVEARFSTNPVALAFPTGGVPMFASFSSAAVALGKVNRMIRLGQTAESPMFMDTDGNVTDDPNVVPQGGTILFLGGEHQGHKGYAMSLWCEALTALAGGDCNNPEAEPRQSFNLTVVDPEAFAGSDYYDREIVRFVQHVKSSPSRPGAAPIRLPGERAGCSLQQARATGVPLEADMVERLQAIAQKNGIEGIRAQSS